MHGVPRARNHCDQEERHAVPAERQVEERRSALGGVTVARLDSVLQLPHRVPRRVQQLDFVQQLSRLTAGEKESKRTRGDVRKDLRSYAGAPVTQSSALAELVGNCAGPGV